MRVLTAREVRKRQLSSVSWTVRFEYPDINILGRHLHAIWRF